SVFFRESEAVHAPGFRLWINLGWLNESAADLECFATANANHFVSDARILTAVPDLLVNRSVAFASELPESESIASKLFWQRLVEVAFVTPSLSRSTRFPIR